jgi:hypothetical protein
MRGFGLWLGHGRHKRPEHGNKQYNDRSAKRTQKETSKIAQNKRVFTAGNFYEMWVCALFCVLAFVGQYSSHCEKAHFDNCDHSLGVMSALKFLAKKSWHTGTFHNQERVWKAEQAKVEEEKRIDVIKVC